MCEAYHKIYLICLDVNVGVNLALLQMRSTPIGAGVTSQFNRPIRVLLPWMNRAPISFNYQDKYFKGNDTGKYYLKGNDTHKYSFFPYRVYSSCAAWRWGTMETWCSGRGRQHWCDHHWQSYIFIVTKTGRLMVWNMRHILRTPVTTEEYL